MVAFDIQRSSLVLMCSFEYETFLDHLLKTKNTTILSDKKKTIKIDFCFYLLCPFLRSFNLHTGADTGRVIEAEKWK